MKKNLYILHQYGAPRHFEALYFSKEETGNYNDIISTEFSFVRQLAKGLLRKDISTIKRSIRNILYLINFLFTKNKDIVVGAAPYDIFIIYLTILKRNHNIIYYSSWPHWDLSNQPKKIYFKWQLKMWRKFLKNIKCVGVTSEVKKGLSSFTEDVTVIPHCINDDIFKPEIKKELGKLKILYVGRLTEDKGLHLIFEIIKNKVFQDQVEWWFVGDGNLKSELFKLQSSHSNVKYLGKVNSQHRLAEIYNECNLLLLPSIPTKRWEELFGIVLIEAMSCGIVPISTNCVGPKTIIDNGKDGFIINPRERDEIVGKIDLLIKDRLLLEDMSHNAIAKVKKMYTIKRTSTIWNDVLGNEKQDNKYKYN